MLEFASLIKEVHPGIFIHLVYLEEELDKDRRAGFVRLSIFMATKCLLSHRACSMVMWTNKWTS